MVHLNVPILLLCDMGAVQNGDNPFKVDSDVYYINIDILQWCLLTLIVSLFMAAVALSVDLPASHSTVYTEQYIRSVVRQPPQCSIVVCRKVGNAITQQTVHCRNPVVHLFKSKYIGCVHMKLRSNNITLFELHRWGLWTNRQLKTQGVAYLCANDGEQPTQLKRRPVNRSVITIFIYFIFSISDTHEINTVHVFWLYGLCGSCLLLLQKPWHSYQWGSYA